MSFWGCVLGRGTCSTLEFLSGVGFFFLKTLREFWCNGSIGSTCLMSIFLGYQ